MQASGHSEASGGSACRRTQPPTKTRPGLKDNRTAPSSSFFMRGLRRQLALGGDLKDSSTSLPSVPTSQLAPSNTSEPSPSQSAETPPSLPLQEIGSRMKAVLSSHGRSGRASKLKSKQRMSRRMRNSDPNIVQAQKIVEECSRGADTPMGYMQLRAAGLLPNQPQTSDSSISVNPITNKLLEVTQKDNFCDAEITGKGNAMVKAPSFVLALHSVVFEEIFYPMDESKLATYGIVSLSDPRKVHIEFASQSTISAAVHYCAAQELPPGIDVVSSGRDETNEANIRTISQLHFFAQLFKIPSLSNATYQTARRLVNKTPSLACAAFDECVVVLRNAESKNCWGLSMQRSYDDLRTYILEFLRESPANTMMGREEGVLLLSPASIEAIICDQDINSDEYDMWRLLNAWVKGAPGVEDDKLATARSLMANIDLTFIDYDKLKYQVKKCGFVDPSDVEEALKQIEFLLENESPDDKERVIVEGAGDDTVNGIYCLADEDIGLKKDEVMFIKEGDQNGGFGSGDFGLFRWGDVWGIANCMDYFNVLYSCEVMRHKGHSLQKPPKWGWKCVGGAEQGMINLITYLSLSLVTHILGIKLPLARGNPARRKRAWIFLQSRLRQISR
ncbi:hypothetical protein ACHAWF_005203 [Thalassiosira exigua]